MRIPRRLRTEPISDPPGAARHLAGLRDLFSDTKRRGKTRKHRPQPIVSQRNIATTGHVSPNRTFSGLQKK